MRLSAKIRRENLAPERNLPESDKMRLSAKKQADIQQFTAFPENGKMRPNAK